MVCRRSPSISIQHQRAVAVETWLHWTYEHLLDCGSRVRIAYPHSCDVQAEWIAVIAVFAVAVAVSMSQPSSSFPVLMLPQADLDGAF